MNRGPQPQSSSRADTKTFVEKVDIAFSGEAKPNWIVELALYADAHGLRSTAEKIDYSKSAISNVINKKYPGDLSRVEQAVRGAFMGATVECPVLGLIGRDRCLHEQDQPFRATSAHRAQLFHFCKRCPNKLPTKGRNNAQD